MWDFLKSRTTSTCLEDGHYSFLFIIIAIPYWVCYYVRVQMARKQGWNLKTFEQQKLYSLYHTLYLIKLR